MVTEQWIREHFDIEELYNIGFLKTKTDFKEIEKRICTFFGFKSIYEWDHIMDEQKLLKAKNIFSEN
jgi:HTH-type transcriptional regulator / antitoxin HigA